MHVLIIGRSGSGKSNFAKCLAKDAADIEDVIVYDPTESTGWPEEAKKYSDPEQFLTDIFKEKNAHVFIDESKTLWDHSEKLASQLIYRLRHNGLLFYLIAQRASGMVPPNARNQCETLIAFRTSARDCEALSAEYGDDVMGASKLDKGKAIWTNGFDVNEVTMIYTDNLIDYNVDKWDSKVNV